jgi:predicted TPR repeat methyltransferase
MKPAALFLSSGDVLADARYERARAYAAEGDRAAAVDLLTQALERAPNFVSAWFALGEIRAQGGDRDGAVHAFRAALAADPSDRHGAALQLARLGVGKPGEAMTPGYVRSLFDQYATHFDEALVKGLGYRGPQLLREALRDACAVRDRPFRFARALDLGCGTGLVGEALRECCDAMIGVDLSPAMVAVARRRGVYADLAVGDMVDFIMSRPEDSFDLVVAVMRSFTRPTSRLFATASPARLRPTACSPSRSKPTPGAAYCWAKSCAMPTAPTTCAPRSMAPAWRR